MGKVSLFYGPISLLFASMPLYRALEAKIKDKDENKRFIRIANLQVFKPVSTAPCTKYRCEVKKMIRGGMIDISVAAIK